jgi:Protein of unknown function (DUF3102)
MTTSITAERTQWAARISAAWQQSVTSIIETGRLLTEAKTALDHGEWLPMVESDLPFQRNTAQRLMKIAADSRLANRAHVPLLPPSWGTLYELTKLDDATFDQKLRDGSINPDMQRKDVARENRILSRERGRRHVENLVPISGPARRGKQVAAISARSASDPRAADGAEEIEPAPTLDPRAWSMSTALQREAFVKAVGRSEIEDAFHAIESGYALTRGLNTLNQAWCAATESDKRTFYRELFPANVWNRFRT